MESKYIVRGKVLMECSDSQERKAFTSENQGGERKSCASKKDSEPMRRHLEDAVGFRSFAGSYLSSS